MTSTSVDELSRLLADPLRARIVELLAGKELCVCHIVEATAAGQFTVSHHLKLLRAAGLVEAEAVGRFTYYRPHPEPLDELAARIGQLARRARQASRNRPACS
jgi:ArsR family transcriptional regulator